jgi:hypothetical protein
MPQRPRLRGLREVFAQPWEGEAAVWQPWWLRLVPTPKKFRFRSEILNPSEDSWDVLDTSTSPNGTVQQRRMHCQQLAPDRLKLTADDMPHGAKIHLRLDGFDFAPYVIRTPVFEPLRLPLRYFDTVRLRPDGTMLETIELRFLGIRIGRVTMRLRSVSTSP